MRSANGLHLQNGFHFPDYVEQLGALGHQHVTAQEQLLTFLVLQRRIAECLRDLVYPVCQKCTAFFVFCNHVLHGYCLL